MKNKKILLFTKSYPYTQAAEHSFLKEELFYLNKKFHTIVLIPQMINGSRKNLSESITIDESLAHELEKRDSIFHKVLLGLDLSLLFIEIYYNPKVLLSKKKIIKLLLYVYEMKRIKRWYVKSGYYRDNSFLIYTYWFTQITSLFAFMLEKNQKIITRVHGIDLYEYRNQDFIPLRKPTLSRIDRVYCVSNAAKCYLSWKYPEYSNKYQVARLGVNKSIANKLETRNKAIFRIVSCSALIPIKRVALILEGVYLFAKENTGIIVDFVHFGDGPLMEALQNQKAKSICENLNIHLNGNIENNMLLKYYENNLTDVFISASASEGGCPVSMQEAQSFGIPCIGTNVGGIPELINHKTGVLLSKDLTPFDIKKAISFFYNMGDLEYIGYRINSIYNWKINFNSKLNFSRFVERIYTL